MVSMPAMRSRILGHSDTGEEQTLVIQRKKAVDEQPGYFAWRENQDAIDADSHLERVVKRVKETLYGIFYLSLNGAFDAAQYKYNISISKHCFWQ